MGKQALISVQQRDHGTYQTELPAPPASRGHPTQQYSCSWSIPPQELDSQAHYHQQGQRKESKQARPGVEVFDPSLSKAQLPFGIAKALLTAKPARVLGRGRLGSPRTSGTQIPDLPLPFGGPGSAQRDPQAVGQALAIGQTAQVALMSVPAKPQGIEWAPRPLHADFRAALAPDTELDAQAWQHVAQRDIGKAAVGRDEQATLPNRAVPPRDHAPDDRRLIAPPPSLQHRAIVGAPIDRHRPAPGHQRDHPQMLAPFNRPVARQTHFALGGQLPQRLFQHGVG